jgi:hypothetical protein
MVPVPLPVQVSVPLLVKVLKVLAPIVTTVPPVQVTPDAAANGA